MGNITKVVYDGDSIYIKDSQLHNKEIEQLHLNGELPSYSIVGSMEASNCENGRADFVVDEITIDRVDFVEEGGCSVCTTNAEPGEILITSKKSETVEDYIVEAESMTETKEEKQVNDEDIGDGEPVKEETPKTNAEVEENVEQEEESEEEDLDKSDEEVDKKEEDDEDTKATDDEEESDNEDKGSDELTKLRQEVADLKKEMEGKKAKVEAKTVNEDNTKIVEHLIQAGKATPAMKHSLMELAQSNPEAFREYTDALGVMIDYNVKSKFADLEKKKAEEDELTVDEAWKRLGRT